MQERGLRSEVIEVLDDEDRLASFSESVAEFASRPDARVWASDRPASDDPRDVEEVEKFDPLPPYQFLASEIIEQID